MSEAAEHPAKPPRFPYIGALLCAACVGAAVWAWMRYSYAWPLERGSIEGEYGPSMIVRDPGGSSFHSRGYVAVRGEGVGMEIPELVGMLAEPDRLVAVLPQADAMWPIWVIVDSPLARDGDDGRVCLKGRAFESCIVELDLEGEMFVPGRSALFRYVDATSSRFTGESIAGLVVGAMGVFVFTVALRHWLRERRKAFTAEDAESTEDDL